MNKRFRMLSLVKIYTLILGLLLLSAVAGSRAVSTFKENAPLTKQKCVIIDAGHGGLDGGATSCTGVLESNINLEIALRLDDLMHLLGMHTKMIRTTDISVHTKGDSIAAKKVSDLKNRVEAVNKTPGAVLISIHQNHFSDNRYSGAQVFYAATADSDLLAKSMQSALVQSLNPGSKRQSKKADGVYLLQNIKCTGILIECGFISNPQEETMLRNPVYQKKLCSVIATTVSAYLHQNTVA